MLFRVLGADLHGFRVVREFAAGQWRTRAADTVLDACDCEGIVVDKQCNRYTWIPIATSIAIDEQKIRVYANIFPVDIKILLTSFYC